MISLRDVGSILIKVKTFVLEFERRNVRSRDSEIMDVRKGKAVTFLRMRAIQRQLEYSCGCLHTEGEGVYK